jgi:hypothetical protein
MVKKPLRTLWIASQQNMTGHTPFVPLFDGALVWTPQATISPQDVVFFDGGTDINSELYGEKPHTANQRPDRYRDETERAAFRKAQAAGAACLGVCRGAQLLCALSGGKLVQHATGHGNGGHMIHLENGQVIYTESSHHQVMWPFEIPHVLIAWAQQGNFKNYDEYGKEFEDDKYPEIVYCKDTKSLCIQGHAEWLPPGSPFHNLAVKLVDDFLINGR